MLRRVNYGNETHINISINVMDDNRAALFVSMDKKNRLDFVHVLQYPVHRLLMKDSCIANYESRT